VQHWKKAHDGVIKLHWFMQGRERLCQKVFFSINDKASLSANGSWV
jgi:hypothetical protein